MNAISNFYNAVSDAVIWIEGPVSLAAWRGDAESTLAKALNRRDLDRLHFAAAEMAAKHPLKDEILPLLRGVRDLYLERWRYASMTGGSDVLDDVEDVDEHAAALRDALDAVSAYVGAGDDLPPENDAPESEKRDGAKATVNARMIDLMLKKPESRGWSTREWAKELKCGKSTVADSATYKELELIRLQQKASKRSDRRRRTTKRPDT